ncbi:hypothetical protein ACG74X_11440 [Marivita sp. S0852]|uniref:hypothetical protein n=1 Tax=Marivita sp. S0852 TaxID=3373893 RepID=UPI003982B394
MTRLMFHIARPITLWSLHFIAIYALISAACAPRGLMETDVMRAVATLGTLATGLLMLFWLIQAMRSSRRVSGDAEERPLVIAALWSAGISLMAIFANLWPVATLASCSG